MADDLRTVLHSRDDEPRQARAVTRFIVLPFRLLRPDAEIDFLGCGLADAITNSLSSLESLVVRSSLAAARFAAAVPDLTANASELNVDVLLTGTLLRVGEQLRVSVQLVEAPGGGLIWSDTSQVLVGELFRLVLFFTLNACDGSFPRGLIYVTQAGDTRFRIEFAVEVDVIVTTAAQTHDANVDSIVRAQYRKLCGRDGGCRGLNELPSARILFHVEFSPRQEVYKARTTEVTILVWPIKKRANSGSDWRSSRAA